ncbi:hypothetical protein [Prevotella histicola]
METLKDLWNNTCLSANIPAITIDTCARLFAIVYVLGNNEALVYNKSFLSDVEYIKKRFHIDGSEVPDEKFSELLKKYVSELEDYAPASGEQHSPTNRTIFKTQAPKWATELLHSRYGIKIIN